MSDVLQKYYEAAFEAAGEGGSIYQPMSILEAAGHERKAALLHSLPLQDLSRATVVDYGVGSWGFGCVFPRLKDCLKPIGVDISQFAVDSSRRLAEIDPVLKGKDFRFLTSAGYDIQLPDQCADLVFAGECIEHIEDTVAFLGEIYRIMRPGAQAVFTTPNRTPFVYGQLGLRWAMGLEHVALMDFLELERSLCEFFDIEMIKGYNSTIHPIADMGFNDVSAAQQWAQGCEDEPGHASGVVVLVNKPTNRHPERSGKWRHIVVESSETRAVPLSRDLPLYQSVSGRMACGDNAELQIKVPGGSVRAQLIFWGHPWSGTAQIFDGLRLLSDVDLYSHVSGCVRVSIEHEQLRGVRELLVRATSSHHSASLGSEVILFRTIFALK